MKWLATLVLFAAVGAAGCGGKADVTVVNNCSRYITGDVKGSTFGIVVGGQTHRSVDVGGGFSSSSDVTLRADLHSGYDGVTPIVGSTSQTMKMSADKSYTWDVYLTSSQQPAFRLREVASPKSITQP